MFSFSSFGQEKENQLNDDSQLQLLAANNSNSDCTCKGIPLKGKVKIVTSFPDLKVQIVDSFADIDVKLVDSFPDDCGEWQIVDSFPDFTIQIVDSFADLKVKYVDSFPGME